MCGKLLTVENHAIIILIEHLFLILTGKGVIQLRFYAGYTHYTTDVAVFYDEESRDKWVDDEKFIPRCALSEEKAKAIIGDSQVFETDHEGIFWLINPINL